MKPDAATAARDFLSALLVATSPFVGVIVSGLAGTAFGISVASGPSYIVFVAGLLSTVSLAIVVAGRIAD